MLMIYLQMIETPADKTKFEILYAEYRGLMYHVAYDILNNVEDAEDAVHNAFVKVAENIKHVDEAVSPKTKSYLCTIVENRSIDVCRMKAKHQEVPFNDETIGIQYEYDGSDTLTKCLSQLSPRYREFLTLKYKFGFNNKEISNMLSLSPGNVRALDKRAKDKLFEFCQKEGLL